MSISVTMRPRRFSTPATSGGESGTAVRRSGAKTSCTRKIGKPNNWPPTRAVTYSLKLWSPLSFMRYPSRSLHDASLFLERRDQALAIELRDVVVETNAASAFNRLRGDDRRQRDYRQSTRSRVGPYRLSELEAVHLRHLDVGNGHVERLSFAEECQRVSCRRRRSNGVACRLKDWCEHVQKER